jgi:capsular polysaccharide biosynthesis protein
MKNFDPNSDSNLEELDLKKIYNLILRNKNFIIIITFISFVISCVYGLTKKRVWQGQFEIVLSKNQPASSPTRSSLIGAIQDFGITGIVSEQNQSLNTEVGILESPSVLMPIFEEVQKKKSKDLIFSTWRSKNLNIKLRKKTSILNISYIDEEKDLIIPVLQKISSAYQDYSGKSARRSNEIAKDYIKSQIKLFKQKSNDSIKKAVSYAIENDLTFSDLQGNLNNSETLGNLVPQIGSISPQLGNFNSRKFDNYINNFRTPSDSSNIRTNSIESIRVSAANEIKNIDFQIKKIEELTEVEDLQYLGSTVPSLLRLGLPQILENIETELIELRSKYMPDDISITRVLEKRDLYIKLLKERSIGYLKARKLAAQGIMESVKRPKGTTIKGKELMREAERDERTLIELENKLRSVELRAARQVDPWKLITNPTLKTIPVSPNRRRIALTGSFIGLILGLAISIYKEKRSQIIFEEEELENLFGLPILKRLIYEEGEIKESPNELQINEIKKESKDKLNIFLSSEIVSDFLEDLKNYFSKSLDLEKDIEFISDDFSKVNSKGSFFLLTTLGKINYQEILNIKKRSEFNKVIFKGIILLTESVN